MAVSNANLEKILPLTKKVARQEVVLDARICVLSGCPMLRRRVVDEHEIYNCGAQIFHANVPKDELDAEIERNPRPVADAGGDNPFLLRILMAPDSTTSYCGLCKITYEEEVLDLTAEQEVEEMFSSVLKHA